KEIAGGYVLKHGNEVSFELGAYDRERELTIDPVLIFSTYVGGSQGSIARGVAFDGTNAYLVGSVDALDLSTPPAPTTFGTPAAAMQHGFVAKLDASGTGLVYVTYFGGSGT